jgi:hypothetical protein
MDCPRRYSEAVFLEQNFLLSKELTLDFLNTCFWKLATQSTRISEMEQDRDNMTPARQDIVEVLGHERDPRCHDESEIYGHHFVEL